MEIGDNSMLPRRITRLTLVVVGAAALLLGAYPAIASSTTSRQTATSTCPTSVSTTLSVLDYATGADPKAKPMS
jgi:hypothetical protein